MFRVKHFDAIDLRVKRHASGAARYEAGIWTERNSATVFRFWVSF
jgi:hypothetical protein